MSLPPAHSLPVVISAFSKKGTLKACKENIFGPWLTTDIFYNTELLQSLNGERLILAGDGRCDSPGHNAKYGTYSIMHVAIEKVLDFFFVQVSELEKEGLKRCLENLETDGQIIDILATDR